MKKKGIKRMRQEDFRAGELPYELWLCSFPDMGNRQLRRLVELCGDARRVYCAGMDQWKQVLKEKQVESLKRFTEEWKPETEYAKLQERGIGLVTLADPAYPERLREIPDAPYGLFMRGTPPGNESAVAVIGARDCSQYGAFVAEKLGETLGRHGITVVSGMARGVDGISQQAALNTGGRSWGVLGCGVDICYPLQNKKLYDRLPRQGCLISSYPLGTPALARNFPPRNRIVSGLADAVIVVEAREKSGTLITVDMALEQGREVYAVPGRITDRLSDGCNRLIRQGAVPFLNQEELLEELAQLQQRKRQPLAENPNATKERPSGSGQNMSNESKAAHERRSSKLQFDNKVNQAASSLSPELSAVYGVLELTPRTTQEIHDQLPPKYQDINLSTCLIRLCLENLAVQVSPGCFCAKV